MGIVGPQITFGWKMGHEVFWRYKPALRGVIVSYRVTITGAKQYLVRYLGVGRIEECWFDQSELDADDT